jgi:hypothetical protein
MCGYCTEELDYDAKSEIFSFGIYSDLGDSYGPTTGLTRCRLQGSPGADYRAHQVLTTGLTRCRLQGKMLVLVLVLLLHRSIARLTADAQRRRLARRLRKEPIGPRERLCRRL